MRLYTIFIYRVTVAMIMLILCQVRRVTNDLAILNYTLCGKYALKRARIVGGENITPGEFPWIVSIMHKTSHLCGGIVVKKNWILTAAHCFCSGSSTLHKKETFNVAVNRNGSRQGMQNFHISLLKLHPAYSCNRLQNDIALLKLSSNISWLDADPACFPAQNESTFSCLNGVNGIAAGWGATNEDFSKGSIPTTMHMVQLPILQNEECQQWYQSQNKSLNLQKSQLCAGYKTGQKDTCWADSGGPLMVKNGVKMVVVGIVSTGIGCARASLPGIYTRLTEYVDWIGDSIA